MRKNELNKKGTDSSKWENNDSKSDAIKIYFKINFLTNKKRMIVKMMR